MEAEKKAKAKKPTSTSVERVESADTSAKKTEERPPRRQVRQKETYNADGEPMTLVQSSHYFDINDIFILDSMRAEIRRDTGDSGVDVSALLRGMISVVNDLRQADKNSEKGKMWQQVVSEAQRLRNFKRPGRWGSPDLPKPTK